MFFRFMVLFFTIATIVLSAWSLVGSYKNEAYLTSNYLLSFQLSNLNVSALLNEAVQHKRDINVAPLPKLSPTPTRIAPMTTNMVGKRDNDKRVDASNLGLLTSMLGSLTTMQPSQLLSKASEFALLTSGLSVPTNLASLTSGLDPSKIVSEAQQIASSLSLPPSLATLAANFNGNTNDLIEDIAKNTNVSQLGLSDMYSIGYWGYCRGSINGTKAQIPELGSFGTQFSNKNVNYTYCTPPKLGYTFDPLAVMKSELKDLILRFYAQVSSGPLQTIAQNFVHELLALVNSVTYSSIGLPGDLQEALPLLGNLTKAGFWCILVGGALALVSFVFQCVGMCCSPDNKCLSCLNFFIMLMSFIAVTLGSGFTTGVFMYVRKTLNNEVKQYGIMSFLSVQYYAFAWSAVVASFCLVVFSIVGYCCGCFKSDRRSFRPQPKPVFRYDHKM